MPDSQSLPYSLQARVHGGPDLAELDRLGIHSKSVLDLSVNINPYGPDSGMVQALARASLGSYPQQDALRARTELAVHCGISVEGVVLGNGASDLLWTVALWLRRALCSDQTLMMVEPTFSELRVAASAFGLPISEHRLHDDNDFDLDFEPLGEAMGSCRAGAIYLCTPSSPLGRAVDGAELCAFAMAHPDVWVIADQSFLSLSARHADAELVFPANVIVVRSLTKDHGIPGVRVGYLLADPELTEPLQALRPTWATGAHTQAAAIYAASGEGRAFVASSRERLLRDTQSLATGLTELGLNAVPSSTCYVTVNVGHAAQVRSRLLQERQVLVRDCTSFGLPNHIRIAAHPSEQHATVFSALALIGAMNL